MSKFNPYRAIKVRGESSACLPPSVPSVESPTRPRWVVFLVLGRWRVPGGLPERCGRTEVGGGSPSEEIKLGWAITPHRDGETTIGAVHRRRSSHGSVLVLP